MMRSHADDGIGSDIKRGRTEEQGRTLCLIRHWSEGQRGGDQLHQEQHGGHFFFIVLTFLNHLIVLGKYTIYLCHHKNIKLSLSLLTAKITETQTGVFNCLKEEKNPIVSHKMSHFCSLFHMWWFTMQDLCISRMFRTSEQIQLRLISFLNQFKLFVISSVFVERFISCAK